MNRNVKVLLICTGLYCLLQSFIVSADPIDTSIVEMLSVPSAMKRLESNGYHDFRMIKIERKHNEIEVKARNKAGEPVKLEMDLYSGIILYEQANNAEFQ